MIARLRGKVGLLGERGIFFFVIGAVLSVGAHPPVGGTTKFGWHSMMEGSAS